MLENKKKIFIYAFVALASLLAINVFSVQEKKYDFLETSLLNILENVAEEGKPEDPDLGIESVTLRKFAEPTGDFNYYRYYATVVIKNYGGDLEDAQAVFSGNNGQKHVFLQNSPAGFSLKNGELYIIDEYEIIFDGNYNGGLVTLNIDLKNQEEINEKNNFQEVEFFESQVKIDGIEVENISKDGQVKIVYDPTNLFLDTADYEIYISNALNFDKEDAKYDEVFTSNTAYGYYRIKASKELIQNPSWESLVTKDNPPHVFKFSDYPFEDEQTYFIYVKAVNQANGYYAVSNILKFAPQKKMAKAEFAKLFIEYADVGIYDKGEILYGDVKPDDWYAPYVQTLFNLGLIDNQSSEYLPDNIIDRAEVLKVVMDYFDVDLIAEKRRSHFKDIKKSDALYPYAQALFGSNKAGVFGEYLNPDLPATRNYMQYLIDEYK